MAASCNQCGGKLTRMESTFPRFDLLACGDCGRPVALLSHTAVSLKATPAVRRRDRNRVLRAARRNAMKGSVL